ncbi:MAG TPA: tRNA (adenosine(37)-N6)-threonylcarbamoyltransferase complex ATPase subunit type 1 TsaE [Mycobacteriales bacterium]|nr:tRNA (adenosine(37)-N6)-threonylcarbamoyltransferase complex ATPase subunit type 1 TsaE [Mycobacteriales bacterium]
MMPRDTKGGVPAAGPGLPPGSRQVPTAAAMHELGVRLAGLLGAGDLIVLSGTLGAGKTTLAQGIGAGLGVLAGVSSPTFVIARVHRGGRVDLVHVDAYRLSSVAEVDDLDLDASIEESVTVVEWGSGLVEGLSTDRLEVSIERPDGPDEELRVVSVHPVGSRWSGWRPDLLE